MTAETVGPLDHHVRTGAAPWPEGPRSRRVSDAQLRQAARTRSIKVLLRDRPDLAGVHAPADFAADSLLWCV
jgi:hypothetical protein